MSSYEYTDYMHRWEQRYGISPYGGLTRPEIEVPIIMSRLTHHRFYKYMTWLDTARAMVADAEKAGNATLAEQVRQEVSWCELMLLLS